MSWWIGDKVKTKAGKFGIYAGKNPEGKAKVKIGDKILIVAHERLSLVTDEETIDWDAFHEELRQHDLKLEADSNPKGRINYKKHQVDLHIETFAPHLQNENSVRILDIQIEKFEAFLNEAYNHKRNPVTVIHGRGEGVLRKQIWAMLELDPRVSLKKLINND
ncbi:MAG TPA: Smr/MutS family protein, partial [Saprospiraceae bacterium]|nr:Smr/MutS family protein [Saprospiraceae bacterium]